MKALIIKTDDSVEVVETNADLDWLQSTVGGYIEHFSGSGDWHGYCNEEGKIQGLPINVLATYFAVRMGWSTGDILAGNVVFLGNGEEGDEASVPKWVLDELHHYLGG